MIQLRPRPGKQTPATQTRRMLIEGILRTEYETAQAEFDRAREDPDMKAEIQAYGKRYIEATVRLRRFLAEGEVPPDIMEKLDPEQH